MNHGDHRQLLVMPPSGDSVTAIVISHNHERYVEQCLQSIAGQSRPVDQLVFIDDGSSDSSFEIARRFAERSFPHHRVIRHERPIGVCRSLNEALRESTGTFVSEISGDDYWLPDKIRSQVAAFAQAPPETAVVYGDAVLVDADGEPTGQTFLEWIAPDGVPDADGLFDRLLLRGNFLPGMSALIRRDRLIEVGGWDEDLFYEDLDMWLQLSSRWPFIRQPEPVAAYRRLATSMSNTRQDDMSLSSLAVATKWAGHRVRADARTLRLTAAVTARHTVRGDFRFLRAWLRLALASVVRRLQPVSASQRQSQARR